MKFLEGLLTRCRSKKKQGRVDPSVICKNIKEQACSSHKKELMGRSITKNLPKWVDMKCNALIYLRQSIKLKCERDKEIKGILRSKSEDKSENDAIIEDKITTIDEINSVLNSDNPNVQEDGQKVEQQPNILNIDNESTKSEDNDLSELVSLKTLSMICPICHLFIYKSSCTQCSHMFCSYCIDEYMLFKNTCPICEKPIRDGKITRCTIADCAIEKILDIASKKNYDQWMKKKFRDDLYFQSKKIYPQDINSSSISKGKINVDVRDSEYIWCEASIIAIIESKDQENSVLVHYKGWDLKYDEVIPVSSPRLAKLGFYTKREEIPHYLRTPNKIKKQICNISYEEYDIILDLKKQIYQEEAQQYEKNMNDSDEDFPNNIDEHYEYLIEKSRMNSNQCIHQNLRAPNNSFLNSNDLRFRNGSSYVYLTSRPALNNFRIRLPSIDSRRFIQNLNR